MAPTPSTRHRLGYVAAGFFAVVLVVATAFSCTRSEPVLRDADTAPTSTSTTETSIPSLGTMNTARGSDTEATPSTAPDLAALPARTSRVATARAGVRDITVFAGPNGDRVTRTLSASGEYGQRQVFLIVAEQGERYQVLLPVRPNGSRGWINADDVDVTSHDYQIQVSLSRFRMIVQKGTRIIVDTPIGVGTQDTPTLGGDFYTWVLLDPTNAGYGSYAYGLSGFSSLESFAGGNGRMGIHGTTDASSIGRTVSHGCVRVPDDVIVQMVEKTGLPLGVPVTIRA